MDNLQKAIRLLKPWTSFDEADIRGRYVAEAVKQVITLLKQISSEPAEQPKAGQEKTSVQGTGDSLQKVIKLAKDLALGQLQMSEEVWENHVKKGANGILALLEKSKAELDAAQQEIRNLEAENERWKDENELLQSKSPTVIVEAFEYVRECDRKIAELEKKLETAKLLLGDYFWT